MKLNLLTTTVAATILPLASNAAVVLNFTLGSFYESDGSSLINQNTIGLMLVNTDGTDTNTLSSTLIGYDLSSTPDPDNAGASPVTIGTFEVVGVYSADASSNYDSQTTGSILLDSGISAGDNLVFVWLPGIEAASGTISAGQSFGVLTGMPGSEDLSGDTNDFVIPNDGSTVNLVFGDTQTAGGSTAKENYVADQVTAIPEPSSFALIGLGALATLFRRRR